MSDDAQMITIDGKEYNFEELEGPDFNEILKERRDFEEVFKGDSTDQTS